MWITMVKLCWVITSHHRLEHHRAPTNAARQTERKNVSRNVTLIVWEHDMLPRKLQHIYSGSHVLRADGRKHGRRDNEEQNRDVWWRVPAPALLLCVRNRNVLPPCSDSVRRVKGEMFILHSALHQRGSWPLRRVQGFAQGHKKS